MLLYIVRHGIPNYETDSLTPDGAKQAEAVSRRLVGAGIDKIYSSPLGRAIQTAEPTAKKLGLDINIRDFASENSAYKGLSYRNEQGGTGWGFWQRELFLGQEDSYTNQADLGRGYYCSDEFAEESMRIIKEGSDEFLKSLGYERTGVGNGYRVIDKNDKKVAMFCHQGMGLHWVAHILGMPFHIFTASFDISHTGVTIIQFDGKGDVVYPKCLCLSDLSHIYGDDLPMKYHDSFQI